MSTEPLLPEKDGAALNRDLSLSSFQGKPTLAERLGRYATAFWLVGPLVIGTAIGWWAPVQGEPCSGLPPAIERLSTIIGWVYFAAWSISFYPQGAPQGMMIPSYCLSSIKCTVLATMSSHIYP